MEMAGERCQTMPRSCSIQGSSVRKSSNHSVFCRLFQKKNKSLGVSGEYLHISQVWRSTNHQFWLHFRKCCSRKYEIFFRTNDGRESSQQVPLCAIWNLLGAVAWIWESHASCWSSYHTHASLKPTRNDSLRNIETVQTQHPAASILFRFCVAIGRHSLDREVSYSAKATVCDQAKHSLANGMTAEGSSMNKVCESLVWSLSLPKARQFYVFLRIDTSMRPCKTWTNHAWSCA